MKKIAIFSVVYNTYDQLHDYVRSIETAAGAAPCAIVDMYVADNTTDNPRQINLTSAYVNITVKHNKRNLGYFSGIQSLMNDVDCAVYDYVIISNVDIKMEHDTISSLVDKDVNGDVGWIAPQIYSLQEKRDRNPKIIRRYGKRKLALLKLMYKHPLLHTLYDMTLYKRKKTAEHVPGYIYGGHGSFIILTREYISRCGKIDYPVFLFGEEIYLAEMCRMGGLLVEYCPAIKVIDIDHASTGNMKKKFRNRCNVEALDYILKAFY